MGIISKYSKGAYLSYINSEAWKAKRQDILRRDQWKCVRCQSKRLLQVHHKTYINFGHELDEDLETLCEWCHRIEHDMRPLRRPASKKTIIRRKKQSPSPQKLQRAIDNERARQLHAEADMELDAALSNSE